MKIYSLNLFFSFLMLSFSTAYSQGKNNENEEQTQEISYSEIKDQNFENKLLALGIDDKQDGKIDTQRLKHVRYLDLQNSDIEDLQGIQYFINLVVLDCSKNKIRSLDLSKNIHLEILIGNHNFIGQLDLKNNPKLKWLTISNNPLEILNTRACPTLENIDISYTYLSKIDFHENPNLQILWANNMSKLLFLDLKTNPSLLELYCYRNPKLERIVLEEKLSDNLTLFDSRLSPKLNCVKLGNGLIDSEKNNWNTDSDLVFKCRDRALN